MRPPERSGDWRKSGEAIAHIACKVPHHRTALRKSRSHQPFLVDAIPLADIVEDLADELELIAIMAGRTRVRPGLSFAVRDDEQDARPIHPAHEVLVVHYA